MRSNIAPLKPQRTGSVRDATVDGPRRTPLAAAMEVVAGVATDAQRDAQREAQREAQRAKEKEPPKMPVRTCSLPAASPPEDSGYESVELSDSTQPQSMVSKVNGFCRVLP